MTEGKPRRGSRTDRRPLDSKPPAPTADEMAEARALLAEHWAGPLGLERWRGVGLPNPEPAWWRILGMAEGYGVSRDLPGDAGALTDLWTYMVKPFAWTALRQNPVQGMPTGLTSTAQGLACSVFWPPFLANNPYKVLLVWASSERSTGLMMAMRHLGADAWLAPRIDATRD